MPADMTYQEWKETFIDGGKIELQEIKTNDIMNLESANAPLLMNSDEEALLTEWINNLEGHEQQKWIKAFADTDYELLPKGSTEISNYNSNTNIVYLHSTDSAFTVVHETAHAIDEGSMYRKVTEVIGNHTFEWEINSASRNVQELSKPFINSDIESIAKHIGVTADKGHFTCSDVDVTSGFQKYAQDILDKFPNNEEAFACVSDIISGLTNDLTNGSSWFGGHDKDYWERPMDSNGTFMVSVEAWADFCALKVSKSENMLSVLKDIVPGIYEVLEQTLYPMSASADINSIV